MLEAAYGFSLQIWAEGHAGTERHLSPNNRKLLRGTGTGHSAFPSLWPPSASRDPFWSPHSWLHLQKSLLPHLFLYFQKCPDGSKIAEVGD